MLQRPVLSALPDASRRRCGCFGTPFADIALRAAILVAAALAWGAPAAATPGHATIAAAASAATGSQGTPEANCAALAREDFGALPDAPTQVTAARFVAASARTPAHCEVQAYVSPNVGFGLWMPAADWNGKFAQIGCGGFCGGVFPDGLRRCAGARLRLRRHRHGPQVHGARRQVGLRQPAGRGGLRVPCHARRDARRQGDHRALLRRGSAACLFPRLLDRRPGRAWSRPQKFPWDYDGIVSGAAVINETGDGMALLWNVLSTHDRDGKPLLSAADLERVHRAAIARCDRDDGVADGLIGDPRRCGFDPAELACRVGQQGDCLGAAQVEAVRKVYQGPRNSKGEALYTGGALPGSELNWIGNYVPRDAGPSTYRQFMGDMFRYMSFMPDPGPTWQLGDFDWDRDYQRLGLMEALYGGQNPDLRRFAAPRRQDPRLPGLGGPVGAAAEPGRLLRDGRAHDGWPHGDARLLPPVHDPRHESLPRRRRCLGGRLPVASRSLGGAGPRARADALGASARRPAGAAAVRRAVAGAGAGGVSRGRSIRIPCSRASRAAAIRATPRATRRRHRPRHAAEPGRRGARRYFQRRLSAR